MGRRWLDRNRRRRMSTSSLVKDDDSLNFLRVCPCCCCCFRPSHYTPMAAAAYCPSAAPSRLAFHVLCCPAIVPVPLLTSHRRRLRIYFLYCAMLLEATFFPFFFCAIVDRSTHYQSIDVCSKKKKRERKKRIKTLAGKSLRADSFRSARHVTAFRPTPTTLPTRHPPWLVLHTHTNTFPADVVVAVVVVVNVVVHLVGGRQTNGQSIRALRSALPQLSTLVSPLQQSPLLINSSFAPFFCLRRGGRGKKKKGTAAKRIYVLKEEDEVAHPSATARDLGGGGGIGIGATN